MGRIVSQECPSAQAPTRTILTNAHGNMGVMSPAPSRDILAANLRRLIDADTPKGQRPSVRAWALGKGLDVRLVDRLTKGQHAVTLDKLEEIAAACGLQAWQLLLDDLDPSAPADAPINDEERALLRRLRRLLSE